MIRVIKNYTDEKYIEDVLVELRELKNDSYQEDDFMEVINVMSKESGLCPICNCKLTYKVEKEIHSELDFDDPHRIEEMAFMWCSECGFEDKED